jgi:hypothetical protein
MHGDGYDFESNWFPNSARLSVPDAAASRNAQAVSPAVVLGEIGLTFAVALGVVFLIDMALMAFHIG